MELLKCAGIVRAHFSFGNIMQQIFFSRLAGHDLFGYTKSPTFRQAEMHALACHAQTKGFGLLPLHRAQKSLRSFCFSLAVACCLWSPESMLFAQPAQDPHLGLPAVAVQAKDPSAAARISLGKSIFFNKRLSADGSISCASCHQPAHAFTDGKPLAQGIRQQTGTRNTPTVLNAAFNSTLFWDGRRPSLETQALDPFINPLEHGLKDHDAVVALLRQSPDYRRAFSEAFHLSPAAISIAYVGKALASYERTLIAGNAPFDRYYFKGEKTSLSAAAARGLTLFQGAARCAHCHTIGKHEAIFTDNQFHSLSVGLQRIMRRLPSLTTRLVHAKENGGSLDQTVLRNEDLAELGRFAVTLNPVDIGKFRTPSLRNVALTAPYMHDGSVATLKDAVELEIYYRSAQSGRPLILTPDEKSDLVEFLKSLTSPTATLFTAPAQDEPNPQRIHNSALTTPLPHSNINMLSQ